MVRMNTVIATHGRCELLARTLASLAEARRPDGFERVIVIENGSDSGARRTCREASGSLPIEYENLSQAGKSRALQKVFDELQSGFVVLLDDDVRVCPMLFEFYADAAARHGEDAFFGGPLLIDYERPPPDWLLDYLPFSVKGWQPRDPESALRWDRFLGANMGLFVARIQKVGGFNPHFGPGAHKRGTDGNPTGQDTEAQNRLLSDGARPVYLAEARVWHWVPKERCTPRWALHRLYRMAMSNAMQEQPPPGPRWFGVPRWMYRRSAQLWWQGHRPLPFLQQPQRFHRKKTFYEWRGRMAGIRRRTILNGSGAR